eukprot:tig00021571_g22361.t1
MREITLVLSGESLENALLVVSRQAAASRKRAAAAAAAEAAKKTREEAPAQSAPPEDANVAANLQRRGGCEDPAPPPRAGAVPFLPNIDIAIIGREMAVGPDAIYADEIALRAAAGSDELAHIHRVYYPDGVDVGGRVSRRAGTTAHARHLNAVSAVLRGVSGQKVPSPPSPPQGQGHSRLKTPTRSSSIADS